MNILVVGGGGREHAIVKTLEKSSRVDKIWCAPGNGGISDIAECVPVKATDIEAMLAFAKSAPFLRLPPTSHETLHAMLAETDAAVESGTPTAAILAYSHVIRLFCLIGGAYTAVSAGIGVMVGAGSAVGVAGAGVWVTTGSFVG